MKHTNFLKLTEHASFLKHTKQVILWTRDFMKHAKEANFLKHAKHAVLWSKLSTPIF